jgi:HEAT repeat protein
MVACLEAAAHFDATSNRIDPALYLPHSDDNVRAAALILLAGKDGPSVMQYMDDDLAKESVTIRIRAAKLACKVKRPEFSMQLVDLLEDSHFWVRYWAARALYALGANGEDILSTMAKEGTVAGRMAGDVLLEMEAINA